MGIRLLVDDARYGPGLGSDPEGLTVADSVNAHLPPHIRVFAVQKVRTAPRGPSVHSCSQALRLRLFRGGRSARCCALSPYSGPNDP